MKPDCEIFYQTIRDLGKKCFNRVDYTGRFKNRNDARIFDNSGSKELIAAEKVARLLAPVNPLDEFDEDFFGILQEFDQGFMSAYDETY